MTVALEAAGRVDTEMVTGTVKRALIDVCTERRTSCQKLLQKKRKNQFPALFLLCGGTFAFYCTHCLSPTVVGQVYTTTTTIKKYFGLKMSFPLVDLWEETIFHFPREWKFERISEMTSGHRRHQNKDCTSPDNKSRSAFFPSFHQNCQSPALFSSSVTQPCLKKPSDLSFFCSDVICIASV